jgi:hypothetical protein
MVERLDLKALQDLRLQTSVLRSTRSTSECIVPDEKGGPQGGVCRKNVLTPFKSTGHLKLHPSLLALPIPLISNIFPEPPLIDTLPPIRGRPFN